MRIITKRAIKEFWEKHRECEQVLLSWYKVVRHARWRNFVDVMSQFGTCKIVGSDRIIFKIEENRFRLIVKITFENQIIWIRFIGTHEEYDKIDPKTI